VPPAALDILTSMGLPGLVIFALGWWINRQDGRLVALQARIDDLQNKRVEDAQRIGADVVALSEALEKQSAKLEAYLERSSR
jgi:uncharacterized membrane-anchored protein